MASATASPLPMAAAEEAPAAAGAARGRRKPVYRRRLRSRIILSYLLLGFGLTLALAFTTNWARNRVETQLVEDVMNRNIDELARRFYANPGAKPEVAFQQMRTYAFAPDSDRLRRDFPEWAGLEDGIYPMSGKNADGSPFFYKLAVRKTPGTWFFVAYDTAQSARGERQFNNALIAVVVVFTLLSLLVGWWAASKVMSPVSELAQRLRDSGRSAQPEALAAHFPDDEVGELAKALDDYAARLTDVVKRDREFNADVSHELRTPLAVIKGAVELMLSRPDLEPKAQARLLRIQRAEQQCTDLTSALLLLSRNERGHGHADVARVAEQLLDAHRAQLRGKPLELVLQGERGLIVDAPEAAVAVALGNLLGNAVKYTMQGTVVVRLLPGAVEVVDSGPGLTAEDAARLFERGYRGAHAEHASNGGGIGLSIVRRLCALYGWNVRVVPGAERGVVATLTFS